MWLWIIFFTTYLITWLHGAKSTCNSNPGGFFFQTSLPFIHILVVDIFDSSITKSYLNVCSYRWILWQRIVLGRYICFSLPRFFSHLIHQYRLPSRHTCYAYLINGEVANYYRYRLKKWMQATDVKCCIMFIALHWYNRKSYSHIKH